MEKIIFGAGCFWGVEAAFRRLKGVADVTCGYAGGHTENPNYEMVCSGKTGHIEVVQIVFDPSEITLDTLLNHFWHCHDPTSQDRQGADIGTQYRSVILCFSPQQEAIAKQSMQALQQSDRLRAPVVTKILPATQFYMAEEYHQRYFEKHGVGHH
jgi:peptide-methionine (S)-S-oxide reductase